MNNLLFSVGNDGVIIVWQRLKSAVDYKAFVNNTLTHTEYDTPFSELLATTLENKVRMVHTELVGQEEILVQFGLVFEDIDFGAPESLLTLLDMFHSIKEHFGWSNPTHVHQYPGERNEIAQLFWKA